MNRPAQLLALALVLCCDRAWASEGEIDFLDDPLPVAVESRETPLTGGAPDPRAAAWGEGDAFLEAPFEIPEGARPEWLGAPALDLESRFARLEIPVRARGDGADLAVTIYHRDLGAGFLRLYWSGEGGAMTLCENLYEGVGLSTQRTVLLERQEIGASGSLVFQSSSAEMAVEAIHLSWVRPALVFAPRYLEVPSLMLDEARAFDALSVSGERPAARPDSWRGPILSALLAEGPERVEAGVVFEAALAGAPGRAVVRVQVLGYSPAEDLVLWVNGARAGRVNVEVPPLADPSYLEDERGMPLYQGWLRGSIYLRPGLVGEGNNTFQLSVENAAGISEGLAVKDLRLEVMYPGETTGGD